LPNHTVQLFISMRLLRALKVFIFVLFSKDEYDVKKGDISDGYHTFGELYEFRMLYNAAFVKEYAKNSPTHVEKSNRHSDGQECFDGTWFVVNIELPTGLISNHYKRNLSNEFMFDCKENVVSQLKYDGHTANDVKGRLKAYLLS